MVSVDFEGRQSHHSTYILADVACHVNADEEERPPDPVPSETGFARRNAARPATVEPRNLRNSRRVRDDGHMASASA